MLFRLFINIIFNWEELIVTRDQNEFFRVKSLLEDQGIKSKTTISNSMRGGISAPMTGAVQNIQTYYLDVKKKHVQEAITIIQK